MYAVIKTGGKQYRVQAGDLLVVEKLEGEPGAEIAFDQVLMLGDGDAVTVGAPLVSGAAVNATLIETRRGEKLKIFKKIRRQGYRRTQGHRQTETVLRVTSVANGSKSDKWDGTVDLTSKRLLDARARGLGDAAVTTAPVEAKPAAPVKAKAAAPKKASAPKAAKAEGEAAPAKKAAPKKAAPKKDAGEA
ncbi:50S ribosomal protein L21 [Caulobacter sp. NIBR2454]|uniref:50S ribosomal protein L21 n=1 Tax=Caulobacter sp. NIBR2454 TaxID=3015996 RepID=UPI0022B6CBC9|nr:50S ribosomal protein L21 [Caulobacter sp. NIBR2454]